MRRTIAIFLFGLVTGIALIHVLEGPLDIPVIRRQARAALDEAGRKAADLTLAASVRAALALQKEFALFGGIEVAASEGVVTLRGTVGSADQRKLAELIARGVEGVERVVNELEVREPRG